MVRTEQVRGTRPRHRLKARSKAKVLKDVWPCVLALTLSFGAGMMVFVHFTYLPKQVRHGTAGRYPARRRRRVVVTTVPLMCCRAVCQLQHRPGLGVREHDLRRRRAARRRMGGPRLLPGDCRHAGRRARAGTPPCRLPLSVRRDPSRAPRQTCCSHTLSVTCCRTRRYFAYIKTPSDFGGADDVFTSVCVAIFVLASGYVTSSAYNAAVRSVRIADRKQAVSLCSSAVFLGLYPAFLASYLMYKNDALV